MAFSYVYILHSDADPERYYSGLTDDLAIACVATMPVKSLTLLNSGPGESKLLSPSQTELEQPISNVT
jgi:hypothetical protein